MRPHRLRLVLLFGLGFLAPTTGIAGEASVALATTQSPTVPAVSRSPVGRQYEIRAKLVRSLPDGKDVVAADPRLVTFEGRQAFVAIGGSVAPPRDVAVEEPLRIGFRFSAAVFRKSERLFLDATAEVSDPVQETVDSLRVASVGVRVMELITLGKTVTVPIANNNRWEITVRESPSNTPVAAEGKRTGSSAAGPRP